ncbi:MAG: aspartate ammonia-lyase [Fibrobacteria bacterium]|nr:aspartate ammonia-lyase [Fibrobacteria bacterium]
MSDSLLRRPVRIEHDLLGERAVPSDAYWGIHTLRALENFPISGVPISLYPELVDALACVKQAAAEANRELGVISHEKADAITQACVEIRGGALHDHFVVDVIQGGAGTSTNMNANEVVCNRALEILGHSKGEYLHLHPLDHVNASQSTNDAYPTALKIALHFLVDRLLVELDALRGAFAAKAVEFHDHLKMGRTQLQDAVPMTLGQEFNAWASMLEEDGRRLREAQGLVREINMGATAIGTGINSHPDYAATICARLSDISGIDLAVATDLIEATQDAGSFVQLSGVLKRVAVKLSKICNDLRLLSSGPRAGLGEIRLPPMAAGSSIMPGKVNPIIPEVVNQISFVVIGNDVTVSFAAESGQLQLNAFEPIMARSLFQSLTYLSTGCRVLRDRCVVGITAERERMQEFVDQSAGVATALNPWIGYARASEIAREAHATRRPVRELVLERGWLTEEQLQEILSPEGLVRPRALLGGA